MAEGTKRPRATAGATATTTAGYDAYGRRLKQTATKGATASGGAAKAAATGKPLKAAAKAPTLADFATNPTPYGSLPNATGGPNLGLIVPTSKPPAFADFSKGIAAEVAKRAAAAATMAAAPVPTAPAAPLAPAAPAKPAVPMDATGAAAIARLIATNAAQRAAALEQDTYDTADHDKVLAQIAQARARDLVQAQYTASAQGLGRSGQLGKQQGIIDDGYNTQLDTSNTAFDRAMAARRAAMAAMGTVDADGTSPLGYSATGTAGLDLTDIINAVTDRKLAADQATPAPVVDDPSTWTPEVIAYLKALQARQLQPITAAVTAPPKKLKGESTSKTLTQKSKKKGK